ncbi:MAG: hypothetical protein QM493_01940 [Sulfurovum sp.]
MLKRLLNEFLVQNNIDIVKIKKVLNEVLDFEGTVAVSLVDYQSELILYSVNYDNFDITLVSDNNNKVVHSIIKMIDNHNRQYKDIVDIVIVHEHHIYIYTYLNLDRDFFIYLIIDNKKTNLALARNKIALAIKQLKLS